MQDLHIAAYQMDIQNAKKEENLKKVQQTISENHRKEIDLWALPEMFTTGFTYSHFVNLAEDLENSITLNKLMKISEEFTTNIAGSYLIKDSKKGTYHNLGFIVTPQNGLSYTYNKIHLWGDEKNYFTAGLDLVEPISINWKAKVGLAICYDLRFPEVYR
ncbi:MAG: nitrilase-related carbon-nitrogen hydrolase, partial [Candidatus Thorarchaeota archaeon]